MLEKKRKERKRKGTEGKQEWAKEEREISRSISREGKQEKNREKRKKIEGN